MSSRSTDPPLYKRDSPYWWTWIYVGTRRKRLSTKCTDRTAALSRARQIQREAAEPGLRHVGETVADALTAWFERPTEWATNTVLNYGGRMMHVAEHLGRLQITRLTREDVEKYVASRLTKGSPRSVRSEVRLLIDALRLAKMRGRAVPDLDLLRVHVPCGPSTKERWLTPTEVDKLCAQLLPHRAMWVRVAVYTGARREEVNELQWDDIDWTRKAIHIRGTKTKRSDRWVPLAAPLIKLIERAAADPDRLVPRVGRRIKSAPAVRVPGKRYPVGPLVSRWKAHSTAGLGTPCRRAGIPICTAHDFRRTFASWLAQAGVAERVVADLLGHANTRLVREVYARLSSAQYADAISKLT